MVRNSASKDHFLWHFRSSIPVLGRDVALFTVSDLPARVVFVLGYHPLSAAAGYIEVCLLFSVRRSVDLVTDTDIAVKHLQCQLLG